MSSERTSLSYESFLQGIRVLKELKPQEPSKAAAGFEVVWKAVQDGAINQAEADHLIASIYLNGWLVVSPRMAKRLEPYTTSCDAKL